MFINSFTLSCVTFDSRSLVYKSCCSKHCIVLFLMRDLALKGSRNSFSCFFCLFLIISSWKWLRGRSVRLVVVVSFLLMGLHISWEVSFFLVFLVVVSFFFNYELKVRKRRHVDYLRSVLLLREKGWLLIASFCHSLNPFFPVVWNWFRVSLSSCFPTP